MEHLLHMCHQTFPVIKLRSLQISTPLHKFAAIPLTPTLLTEPGEMSELPARLFKTFSYCLETVHFYSAEQVLRKDMKEKKPRIVVRDFLKHNFLDLLYECNGTGGTTSRWEKSINGRRTHVNGSKELFTILNLSMFLSAKTVYCVYIWSFPFFLQSASFYYCTLGNTRFIL